MLELDIIWGAFLRELDRTDFNNFEDVEQIINVINFAMVNLFICDDTSFMPQVHLLVNFIMNKILNEHFALISPTVAASLFELNYIMLERLNFPAIETLIDAMENIDMSSMALNSSKKFLFESNVKICHDDLPFLLFSNIKMITSNSKLLINFSSSNSSNNIEIFRKSSLLLHLFHKKGIFCDNLKFDCGLDMWSKQLLLELKLTKDIYVIKACLGQISEFSYIWTEKRFELCEVLIQNTLPLLWLYFREDQVGKGYICLLITDLCRILPNESDIYFAKILSSAVRNRKFDLIELFTELWDLAISCCKLDKVPLRISVLILVDSMTRNEFEFRKCSFSWIFSISKYLDRFLIPAFSSFIDILECGINEASNSTVSSKQAFPKKFDKYPLIYYLNIIERLLEVDFENVHNYLSASEVEPYLMIQLAAFVDLIKRHLSIDFEFNYSKN